MLYYKQNAYLSVKLKQNLNTYFITGEPMKPSRIFTKTLSLSLLFSCPQTYSNSTALSLSDIEHVIDINHNSYVYVTPEVIQNIKQLKAFIKPESWPHTLTQLTQAFDEQKLFITRQVAQAALQEALAIVNHPDMPATEKQNIKESLENYAQDIESGKALVSIEQENTLPQNRKSCSTPTRIGIFCDLLVKQNLNVRGTVKINNLNGILQATDGIVSASSITPETENFSGTLEGDVTGTQKNTVVSFVCGAPACDLVNTVNNVVNIVNSGTPLNEPNTLVLRDNTGSFAAQNIAIDGSTSIGGSATVGGNAAIVGSLSAGLNISTAQDVVVGRNIDLTTNPSTATAGNILKNGAIFIHNVGTNNTGIGIGALNPAAALSSSNTAVGTSALAANTGDSNTALGNSALKTMTGGTFNTACGAFALETFQGGNSNTALGAQTLRNLTLGTSNTAVGDNTLSRLLTGSTNVAIGLSAGSSYIGAESNNVAISNLGNLGDNNTIRIGGIDQVRVFLAGVASNATPPGTGTIRAVTIDTATGQLFYTP